jgi:UDP-GlcNAc:undecaprenyl-phosphate GlcNAc-1-phosphate transferase
VLDELRDTPEVIYGAAIALVVVVLLTPAVGGMARLLGVVDRPGEDGRRLHRRPVPRLGGLAIFLGIVVPSLAFLDLSSEMRGVLLGAAVACVVGAVDDFRGLAPAPKLGGQIVAASIPCAFGVWIDHFTFPFLGAAVACVVGAVDDFRGLAPAPKLGGQIVAASIPCAFGVWIDHFTFPFLGAVDLPAGVGVPLTVLWIVAVMNMVNFLDGMDGLAAGVCAISGVTFSVLALSLGKADAAILSAIVAGACIGFLRHNFFPARIFMGDSGALVLGYTLATVSVAGLLKTASTIVLFLPLVVLAVPIVDTSFVVAKRLKHGRPVYSADRWHLHHRFVNIGFSQRRAAVTMWAWCATLGLVALATRFVPFREGGVWHAWETVAVALLGFSVYIVYLLEIVKLANPRIRRRGAEQERERMTA